MDVKIGIGKREELENGCWSPPDTQEGLKKINCLVSAKKEELSKKLFYEVNKQSLRLLFEGSFKKPRWSANLSSTGSERTSSSSSITNPVPNFQRSGSVADAFGCSALLKMARQYVAGVEDTFSKTASSNDLEMLKRANISLFHLLSTTCKTERKVRDFILTLSSEDVAIALLTLSCKKVKITKNHFAQLLGAFSAKNREELLRKEKCYFILVWLLEGQPITFEALLEDKNPSYPCRN